MEIFNIFEEQFIENKSKFISILLPLQNKDDFKEKLIWCQKKYPLATHYCYAMRYNGYEKASDDNEPKGTAGKPILKILQIKNIDKVILVVVRYFGGKKLGASKLLRAYVKSAALVVEKALEKEGQ